MFRFHTVVQNTLLMRKIFFLLTAVQNCVTSSSAIAETARHTSYFDLQTCEVEFLSPPFEGLRGNVDASCVHR